MLDEGNARTKADQAQSNDAIAGADAAGVIETANRHNSVKQLSKRKFVITNWVCSMQFPSDTWERKWEPRIQYDPTLEPRQSSRKVSP